jgi:hypothetical protein
MAQLEAESKSREEHINSLEVMLEAKLNVNQKN